MLSIWLGATGRCPRCRKGELFQSWWEIHETCPHCGARFYRGEGYWIGPTALGYGIGAAIGVGGGFFMVVKGYYFKNAEIVLALTACAVTLASFHFVKGAWVGMLHSWGYVYPDKPK